MKKLICLFILFPLFYILAAERQVVISKIDIGLQNSDKYNFTTLSPTNTIKGLNGTSLDTILEFDTSSEKNFTYISSTGKYSYPFTSKESYIIFPVTYNSLTSIKSDNIKLVEEELTSSNDLLTKVTIDETINLPGSTINLVNSTTANTGNLFTYSENSSLVQQHFEKFKNQEYMIRISKGTVDYDYDAYNKLNKIKPASINDNNFLTGILDYMDFYFTGDDYLNLQKIITPTGIVATFIPGRIEIFGLPQGAYTIALYSFRYSTEYSDKGNVVVTRENKLTFTSKSVDITKNLIIKNLDVINHPIINGELILISPTINPTYTIREQLGTGTFTAITPTTSTRVPITSSFYYNLTSIITPDGSGYDAGTNKYYYKVNFTYTSPNSAKNTTQRTVELKSASTTELISYYTKYDILPKITTFPYQTVIIQLKTSQNLGNEPYEIVDKVMSPSTYGYRGVKYITTSTLKNAYLGTFTNNGILNFDNSTYKWNGTSGIQQNIMINKTISDSKATYHRTGISDSNIFSFYTLRNIQGFIYEQEGISEIPENASFLWQDSVRSTYGVIVNDEELIFRITKLSSSSDTGLETKSYTVADVNYTAQIPKYYLDIYNNTNPIGTYNETTNIENFVSGTKPYLDLIFKKGEDRKIERANAIFSFFKDNKFDIIGLPRGSYMIQTYTVKGADLQTQKDALLDYKTITFEASKKFEIGLPELVYGDFANMNNLFLIESINVNSSFDINTNLPSKQIKVNFITKTSEAINLSKSNLTAKNMELTDGGPYAMPGYLLAEHHQNGSLMAISDANLAVYKADKTPFQFPLDIVFLIDDSGSMQNEIDNVKNGLSNFASQLEAKGYNVKFNLVTFGPDQNQRYSGTGNNYPVGSWVNQIYQYQDSGYLAIYKADWFTDVNELIGAFGQLNAIWGYYNDQENGAQAIYNGANLLKNNGRYLDYNNNIVSHNSFQTGYIPSKKLLIFLTDENFDIESLNLIPGVTGNNSTARYNSYRSLISNLLKTENIGLNGIYHINTGQNDILGNAGVTPADTGDRSYNEFISMLGTQFSRYEMGSNGQLVIDGLTDTVKNSGIIQRWVLSYQSPFIENDGQKREVIYSLTGLKSVSGADLTVLPYIKIATKDRFYFVQEDKIESYFIKPDPVIKQLIKKNGQIQVEIKARSQYNEVQSDGTSKLVNYAIEKGSFKLNGNSSQMVLLSDKNEISIIPSTSGWYTLISNIDAEKYYSLFGDEPVEIEATVASKYYGKTINLSVVKLTELDEPLITSLKLENITLKNLLESLKNQENQSIFSNTEINDLTTVKYTKDEGFSIVELNSIFSTASNKLNLKLNDLISYELITSDESVLRLNGSKVYIGGLVTDLNKTNNIYTGNTTIISTNLTMKIMLYDDYGNVSSLKNNGILETFNPFFIPNILSNSQLSDGEYFSFLNTGSTNPNTALISSKESSSEALAYLIAFDYNDAESDYGLYDDDSLVITDNSYPIITKPKYWAASRDGKFILYDGKYNATKVYFINKAGEIGEISSNTLENIILDLSNVLNSRIEKIFYVDTVAPRIVNRYVRKTSDSNGLAITGNDLPFKENDFVSYRYEIEDFNFDLIELNFSEFLNKLMYVNENISLGTINLIDKNFRVTKNSIGTSEDIVINSNIYDKAQNSSITDNTGVYNSRLPKQMRFQEMIFENNIKFTNDKDITLNSFGTGENISYARVTLGDTKDTNISSLPIKLSAFGMSGVENIYNMGTITTYSLSGQAGIPFDDAIVVDTEINENILPILLVKKSSEGKYITTIKFNEIKELVGLNGIKILTTGPNITNDSPNAYGYYSIIGAGYFIVPTASNTITSYTLEFPTNGYSSISIVLKDRLDNTKTFTQTIKNVSVYNLIGASVGTGKVIKTKIEVGDGYKIVARE